MILSVVYPKIGSNQDVDNPDSDSGDIWAAFIPADVAPLVKATQIVAILAYVIFADSTMVDIALAVILFPTISEAKPEDKTRRMAFSAILRGTQSILGTISMLLLVIISTTVIDIILNFTA